MCAQRLPLFGLRRAARRADAVHRAAPAFLDDVEIARTRAVVGLVPLLDAGGFDVRTHKNLVVAERKDGCRQHLRSRRAMGVTGSEPRDPSGAQFQPVWIWITAMAGHQEDSGSGSACGGVVAFLLLVLGHEPEVQRGILAL